MVVGGENYDMPWTVLMLVADGAEAEAKIIEKSARIGCIEDDRIFLVPVEDAQYYPERGGVAAKEREERW